MGLTAVVAQALPSRLAYTCAEKRGFASSRTSFRCWPSRSPSSGSQGARFLASFVHSKSNDPVRDALDAATRTIAEAIRALAASNPVVLIDGRSGSGKTSLARKLAAHWPIVAPPQLISLDSLYPGWDGLDAGVDRAVERILNPHGRGRVSTWQRWDWETGSEAESYGVNPALGIVLEGCGSITPATVGVSDIRVWVESPEPSRRRRALERDGDAFRPHWDAWAAQETRHIDRDDPRGLATIRVEVP